MLRAFACALVGLFLVAGGLLAEELKGKIVKVDSEKKTITISVDGKDKELRIAETTKLLSSGGKDLKEGIKDKHLKEGAEVTVTVDKDQVKEIKLAGKK